LEIYQVFFLNSLSVELKSWINSRALDLNQMLVTWVIRTSDILGKVSGSHSLHIEGLAHGGKGTGEGRPYYERDFEPLSHVDRCRV
jgi:hypothetical protein